MKGKISIIVPIYNAEKYIEKCIVSIVQQTYKNWELLLIDDGSIDNSSVICKDYATQDSRIKYIYQTNNGVSVARNTGLENAKGDWIMFVDADDQIKPNTLFACSELINDYDIIRFEAIDTYGRILELPSCQTQDYIYEVIQRKTFLAIWGGLYKRKIFKENNIKFDSQLKYGEDWIVLIQLIMYSSRVFFLKEILYEYNNGNESSFLNTMTFQKQLNLILCYNKIRKFCVGKIPEKDLAYTKHIIQFGLITTILKEKKNLKSVIKNSCRNFQFVLKI